MTGIALSQLLSLILLAAAPAFAAPIGEHPSPSTPADGQRVAEALLLLEAEDFDDQVMTSAELSLEASMAAMTEAIQKQVGDKIPEEFLSQLRQLMREHARATMRAGLQSLKMDAARLYAVEFTLDELIRLRELSRDPVIVKARERNKVLQPKLMMLGIQTMRASQPELEAKINRLVAEFLAKQNESPSS